MNLIEQMKSKIQGKGIRMVFVEGWDARIMQAAAQLKADGLMDPILLGDIDAITKTAQEEKIDLASMEVIDPKMYEAFDAMVAQFVEIRKGKASEEQARELLLSTNYFGTMLVKLGLADGLVGGVLYSTGDTVRPALQIIKTKPGISKVSGMVYMQKDDKRFMFSDCAINVAPTSEDLVAIAEGCLDAAPNLGIDEPRIAFLSFSSNGSAKGEEVDKVRNAAALFAEKHPETMSDGELQFDAAIVPSVAAQKVPDSKLAGEANIFIFPDLEAGNIGYKIAQRLGGYDALGPILLGLNAPINDLSRGASAEDAYKVAIITAAQV